MSPDLVQRVLNDITYEDWRFEYVPGFLHVRMLVNDNFVPNVKQKFLIRFEVELTSMTETEILTFVMSKVEKIVLHEAQEKFRYQQHRPFNPHRERQGLWADTSRLLASV